MQKSEIYFDEKQFAYCIDKEHFMSPQLSFNAGLIREELPSH